MASAVHFLVSQRYDLYKEVAHQCQMSQKVKNNAPLSFEWQIQSKQVGSLSVTVHYFCYGIQTVNHFHFLSLIAISKRNKNVRHIFLQA